MDVEEALSLIAQNEKADKCLYLLQTYIRNALNQPDDHRKRTIPTANESFHTEVAAVPGGVDVLTAVGFEKGFADADQSIELLTLPSGFDQSSLRAALAALQQRVSPPNSPEGSSLGLAQIEAACLGQSGVPLVSLPPTLVLAALERGLGDEEYFWSWANHHLGAVIKQVVEQKGQPSWDEMIDRWKESGQDRENDQAFNTLIELLTRLSTQALRRGEDWALSALTLLLDGDSDGLYRTTSSTIEWVCGAHGSYTKNKLLVRGASHLLWSAVQCFLQESGPNAVAELVREYNWEAGDSGDSFQHLLDLIRLLLLCFKPAFNSDERVFQEKHNALCTELASAVNEAMHTLATSVVGSLESAFVGGDLHKGGELVSNALRALDDELFYAGGISKPERIPSVGSLVWGTQAVWRAAKLHDLKTDKLMVRVDAMKKLATAILKGYFNDAQDFQEWALQVDLLELVLGERTVNNEAYSCAASAVLQSLEFSPEQFAGLVWPLLSKKLDQNVIQEVFLKVCLDPTMPRYSMAPSSPSQSTASEMGFQDSEITSITDAVDATKAREEAELPEAATAAPKVPVCTPTFCVAMTELCGVLKSNPAAEPFTLRLLQSCDWKPFMKDPAAALATTALGWSTVLQAAQLAQRTKLLEALALVWRKVPSKEFSQEETPGSLANYAVKCIRMIESGPPAMHSASRPLSHVLLEGILNAMQPVARDLFIKCLNDAYDVLELLLADLRSALQMGTDTPEMQQRLVLLAYLLEHCDCITLSTQQVQDIGLLNGTLAPSAEAELFQWLTSLMSNGNCLAEGVKDWLLQQLTTRTSNPAGLGMELYLSFCACFMCVNDIVAPPSGHPDLGPYFRVSTARGVEGLWAMFLHSDDQAVVRLAKSFLLLLYGKAFYVPPAAADVESPDWTARDKALSEIEEMDEDDNCKAVLKESVMEQYADMGSSTEPEVLVAPFDERYMLVEEAFLHLLELPEAAEPANSTVQRCLNLLDEFLMSFARQSTRRSLAGSSRGRKLELTFDLHKLELRERLSSAELVEQLFANQSELHDHLSVCQLCTKLSDKLGQRVTFAVGAEWNTEPANSDCQQTLKEIGLYNGAVVTLWADTRSTGSDALESPGSILASDHLKFDILFGLGSNPVLCEETISMLWSLLTHVPVCEDIKKQVAALHGDFWSIGHSGFHINTAYCTLVVDAMLTPADPSGYDPFVWRHEFITQASNLNFAKFYDMCLEVFDTILNGDLGDVHLSTVCKLLLPPCLRVLNMCVCGSLVAMHTDQLTRVRSFGFSLSKSLMDPGRDAAEAVIATIDASSGCESLAVRITELLQAVLDKKLLIATAAVHGLQTVFTILSAFPDDAPAFLNQKHMGTLMGLLTYSEDRVVREKASETLCGLSKLSGQICNSVQGYAMAAVLQVPFTCSCTEELFYLVRTVNSTGDTVSEMLTQLFDRLIAVPTDATLIEDNFLTGLLNLVNDILVVGAGRLHAELSTERNTKWVVEGLWGTLLNPSINPDSAVRPPGTSQPARIAAAALLSTLVEHEAWAAARVQVVAAVCETAYSTPPPQMLDGALNWSFDLGLDGISIADLCTTNRRCGLTNQLSQFGQRVTCYMNSFLQQLYNSKALRTALLQYPPNNQLVQELQLCYTSLTHSVLDSYDTRKLCAVCAEMFWGQIYAQNDASEFAMWLVDKLFDAGEGTPFDIRTQVTCAWESINGRKDQNWMIMAKCRDDKGILLSNLDDIIRVFLGVENGERQASFTQLPDFVFINTGRYTMDADYNSVKLDHRVSFPMEMDFGKFSLEQAQDTYTLQGVVVHMGVAGAGHYWSLVWDETSEQWLKCDDENIYVFDGDFERECFGGDSPRSAFILVYRRINPTTVVPPPTPEPDAEAIQRWESAGSVIPEGAACEGDGSQEGQRGSPNISKNQLSQKGRSMSAGLIRCDPSGGLVFRNLRETVEAANKAIWRQSLLFDPAVAELCLGLCQNGARISDPAELKELAKLGCTVFLNVVAHDSNLDDHRLAAWSRVLTELLQHEAGASWFLVELRDQELYYKRQNPAAGVTPRLPWLHTMVLLCPSEPTVDLFTVLLAQAVAVCRASDHSKHARMLVTTLASMCDRANSSAEAVARYSRVWHALAKLGGTPGSWPHLWNAGVLSEMLCACGAIQVLLHLLLNGLVSIPQLPVLTPLQASIDYSHLLECLQALASTPTGAAKFAEQVEPEEVRSAVQRLLHLICKKKRPGDLVAAVMIERVGGVPAEKTVGNVAIVVSNSGVLGLSEDDAWMAQEATETEQQIEFMMSAGMFDEAFELQEDLESRILNRLSDVVSYGGTIDGVYQFHCNTPNFVVFKIFRPIPCRAGHPWFYCLRPKQRCGKCDPDHWYIAALHTLPFVYTVKVGAFKGHEMGDDQELRDLASDYILESVEIGTGEHAEEMLTDPRIKALSGHYNYKYDSGEKAIVIYSCPVARDGSNDVLPPSTGWELYPEANKILVQRAKLAKLGDSPNVEVVDAASVIPTREQEEEWDASPLMKAFDESSWLVALEDFGVTHKRDVYTRKLQFMVEETKKELSMEEALAIEPKSKHVKESTMSDTMSCVFCKKKDALSMAEAWRGQAKSDIYSAQGTTQVWLPCKFCHNASYHECPNME